MFPQTFKDPFQMTATTQPTTLGGMRPVAGYKFSPYQVKTGDTFESIASSSGFDIPAIQQANNGMIVPPPKGSYINLPAQPNALGGMGSSPYGPQPYTPNPYSDGLRLPDPVSLPGQAYQPPYGPPRTTVTPGLGNTRGPTPNLNQLVPELTQQLSSGALPPIPAAATQRLINPETGQPITPQELIRMGYVFDAGSRNWINSTPNSAAAQGGGAAGTVTTPAGTGSAEFMNTGFMRNYASKGTDFMNQRRWDGKKFVKIGDLVRQGRLDLRTGRMYDQRMKRNKHGKLVPKNKGQQPAPAEPVLGSGTAPSNQLNTNQGGG